MHPPEGALVGLAMGLAVLLLASWWRARRRLQPLERIAPFVGLPGWATAAADPTLGPRRLLALAQRAGSDGDRGLAALLRRAGRPDDPSAYRLERVLWAGLGGAIGLLAGLLVGMSGSTPVAALALAATGGAAGWLASDARLRAATRRRGRTMAGQLPLLADLVALAVSAGATVPAALEGAARTMGGPLGAEVDAAVREVHGGAPVDRSLRRLADAVGLPALQRLVDALLVAIDHGTPVADVARAQAVDIRADERRRLVESAGRKDAVMLVPIVFLVLPSVVLVAVFPGVQALHLVVP